MSSESFETAISLLREGILEGFLILLSTPENLPIDGRNLSDASSVLRTTGNLIGLFLSVNLNCYR